MLLYCIEYLIVYGINSVAVCSTQWLAMLLLLSLTTPYCGGFFLSSFHIVVVGFSSAVCSEITMCLWQIVQIVGSCVVSYCIETPMLNVKTLCHCFISLVTIVL